MTFIHFENYMMINDIKINIMNSMNLFCSSMNYTSVKSRKQQIDFQTSFHQKL